MRTVIEPGVALQRMLVDGLPNSLTEARLDAFCELAVVLHAMAGCVSVEMNHRMARGLTVANMPAMERSLEQPGMTLRRLRERNAYDMRTLDREIPSPEWGLFLGKKHLEVMSADTLEASGVFHEVRRLGDDLVLSGSRPIPWTRCARTMTGCSTGNAGSWRRSSRTSGASS